MAGKKCQICGKNSGIYPLCVEHLNMKKNGFVIKNENTGKWELVEENKNFSVKINTKPYKVDKLPSPNTEEDQKVVNCLLCNEEIDERYTYCRDCYYNVQDRIEELDKNQRPSQLKDYYYNAKDYAMRIFDEDKIYYQKLTMCAISDLLEDFYEDDSISMRIVKDIERIDENLNNRNQKLHNSIKETSIIEEVKIERDKDKAKTKKTQDGHFVESEYEIKVDDMLYNHNFVHAYNIKVDEITERSVYCDWYIPVLLNKGIYIELWGVKGNEKYNNNKKEKIDLYKKHNLHLIEIEYDELKDDTQRLRSSLIGKIKTEKNKIIIEETKN